MSAVEARPLGESDFTRFRDLVQRTSGIELSEVRRSDLERAVLRTVEQMSMHGPAELYAHLSHGDSAVDLEAFIAELTIGETYFFRHRAQFDALERTILPDLIARRAQERRLRIWSAGCATGEEPYSLAIMLDRLLPDRASWSVMILGTDINRTSLEQAQRGTYRSWSFRGVDTATQSRYFTRSGDEHRISPEIAGMVTFSYLNLVGDAYPSLASNTTSMDLVLCRNVLIYFGAETINGVLGRIHDSMCEGGWLVSGPADTSPNGYRASRSARSRTRSCTGGRSGRSLRRPRGREGPRCPHRPRSRRPLGRSHPRSRAALRRRRRRGRRPVRQSMRSPPSRCGATAVTPRPPPMDSARWPTPRLPIRGPSTCSARSAPANGAWTRRSSGPIARWSATRSSRPRTTFAGWSWTSRATCARRRTRSAGACSSIPVSRSGSTRSRGSSPGWARPTGRSRRSRA